MAAALQGRRVLAGGALAEPGGRRADHRSRSGPPPRPRRPAPVPAGLQRQRRRQPAGALAQRGRPRGPPHLGCRARGPTPHRLPPRLPTAFRRISPRPRPAWQGLVRRVNPDASLSAAAGHGRRWTGRRYGAGPPASAGTGPTPRPSTSAVPLRSTPASNTGALGRTGGRCASPAGNACSGRLGSCYRPPRPAPKGAGRAGGEGR